MPPGFENVALTRCIAERVAEQVGHSSASGQGFEIPGVAHVGDEANEVVFVGPHIPFGPSVLVEICAEVTIRELALDQFRRDVIELLAERWISGIHPGQGGGVQPFSDVFAIPSLATGAFAVPLKQTCCIQFDQPIRLVRLNSASHPTCQVYKVRRFKLLSIADKRSHLVGEGGHCAYGQNEHRHNQW